MVSEVLEHLRIDRERTGVVVDGTVGAGGHAQAILEMAPHAMLLGIDRDPAILRAAAKRLSSFGSRAVLTHGSYADVAEHLRDNALERPCAILLDVGVSSLQLDSPERGFSFSDPSQPLDMRFDATSSAPTAAELLNVTPWRELADMFFHFGDIATSRALARAIVAARPLHTVGSLREVAEPIVGRGRRHDAMTRVFQALRIAVNEELDHLERGLSEALAVLRPAGRLVVLAFQSGEERVVKRVFHEHRKTLGGRVITKKPVRAGAAEISQNRRARPARLRAFEVA